MSVSANAAGVILLALDYMQHTTTDERGQQLSARAIEALLTEMGLADTVRDGRFRVQVVDVVTGRVVERAA